MFKYIPKNEEAPTSQIGANEKSEARINIVSACLGSRRNKRKHCVICGRFLGNSNYENFNGRLGDIWRDFAPKCNTCLEGKYA